MGLSSRPLGKIESFFQSLTKVGLFNCFFSCIILNKPLDEERDKLLLTQIVHDILKEYPILLCNVFDNEVRVVDGLQLSDVLEFWSRESQSLQTVWRGVNKLRFDTSKLLFKIIIVNGDSVHFVFDHTLSDGMSSVNLLELFVQRLNSTVTKGSLDNLIDINSDLTLPLPIDILVDFLAMPYHPATGIKSHDPWKSNKPCYNHDHSFHRIIFTPEEVAQIKGHCLEHKVTMTPFLQNCFIVAMTRLLDTDLYHDITYGVNIRRYIKTDPDRALIGCNVSGSFDSKPSSLTLNWDQVVDDNSSIHKLLEDGSMIRGFGDNVMANEVTNWDQVLSLTSIILGEKTRKSLMFTNLGYHKFPCSLEDNYRVTQSYFAQSTHNLEYFFASNILSDDNGMTIVNTMVDNDQITEAQFVQLNEYLKDILLNPS